MIRASFDKGHKHRSEVSFDIDHTDMVRPSRKRVSESMRMPPGLTIRNRTATATNVAGRAGSDDKFVGGLNALNAEVTRGSCMRTKNSG